MTEGFKMPAEVAPEYVYKLAALLLRAATLGAEQAIVLLKVSAPEEEAEVSAMQAAVALATLGMGAAMLAAASVAVNAYASIKKAG